MPDSFVEISPDLADHLLATVEDFLDGGDGLVAAFFQADGMCKLLVHFTLEDLKDDILDRVYGEDGLQLDPNSLLWLSSKQRFVDAITRCKDTGEMLDLDHCPVFAEWAHNLYHYRHPAYEDIMLPLPTVQTDSRDWLEPEEPDPDKYELTLEEKLQEELQEADKELDNPWVLLVFDYAVMTHPQVIYYHIAQHRAQLHDVVVYGEVEPETRILFATPMPLHVVQRYFAEVIEAKLPACYQTLDWQTWVNAERVFSYESLNMDERFAQSMVSSDYGTA